MVNGLCSCIGDGDRAQPLGSSRGVADAAGATRIRCFMPGAGALNLWRQQGRVRCGKSHLEQFRVAFWHSDHRERNRLSRLALNRREKRGLSRREK